jgi:hypothetical protein
VTVPDDLAIPDTAGCHHGAHRLTRT